MKETELPSKENIEISVTQKQQKGNKLIGKIVPHNGHKMWEINTQTLEVKQVKYSNATYSPYGETKKEIIIKQGCVYISALNEKNALKKYKKKSNGGKEFSKESAPLFRLDTKKKKKQLPRYDD